MPSLPGLQPVYVVFLSLICGSVIAENYSSFGVPPIIVSGPPPHRLYNDAQPITLKCQGEGFPQPKYQWYKDGAPLQEETRDSLKISYATRRHEGRYQCLASNQFGVSMSNITYLQRLYLASETRSAGTNASHKDLLVGRSFVATCHKMKGTEYSYEWQKITSLEKCASRHGKRVKESSRISIYEENGSMAFSNLEETDNGTYKCFARGAGQLIGAGCFQLSLTNPFPDLKTVPKFMHHSRSPHEVMQGEDFHLECFFSGNPTPNVIWTKDGRELPRDRYSTDAEVGHRIKIHKARPGDGGYYECQGSNQAGHSDKERIQVKVNAAPSIVIKPMSKNVSLHENVKFICESHGVPDTKTIWYKNTQEVTDEYSPHMRILKQGSILEIKQVTEIDTAVYQCNVSNTFGYRIESAYLIVSEKFRPTITVDLHPDYKPKKEKYDGDTHESTEEHRMPWGIWILIGGAVLVVLLVALMIIFIRKRRRSLSYQLGSVDSPEANIHNGTEPTVGNRLLELESPTESSA